MADEEAFERAISSFAALERIDRSLDLTEGKVTRLVCEVFVADLNDVPRTLTICYPDARSVDVTVTLLRFNSEADDGDDGGASTGGDVDASGEGEPPGRNIGDASVIGSSDRPVPP
ncbi:hypothetical protein GUJ93_ZPchr0006g45283 [Zizania palustris]|uniref:Uncharacterized protein n=1 Tax=Zizania palustris TaxID=103762 RepID=A0A8J5VMP2_ZIZPA|nr:hypothetical protein GUJ93_ZPchr0006g45283 [Zizania palustris]